MTACTEVWSATCNTGSQQSSARLAQTVQRLRQCLLAFHCLYELVIVVKLVVNLANLVKELIVRCRAVTSGMFEEAASRKPLH